MTPERFRRLTQTLKMRQPDLTVIADEVHKGRNLSAIVRTCDAVGIDRVHTVVPKRGYRGFRGTASGSHKWVEVLTYESASEPITQLQASGFQVVAASIDQSSRNYLDVDYRKPTALLLGSEKLGLSDAALALADKTIYVPMVGMVESLNVSVACAIILQEAHRQRADAGLYGGNQLPEAEQKRRFFQWAHPTVASFCDERGITYPEVDPSDGEIIDGPHWLRTVQG